MLTTPSSPNAATYSMTFSEDSSDLNAKSEKTSGRSFEKRFPCCYCHEGCDDNMRASSKLTNPVSEFLRDLADSKVPRFQSCSSCGKKDLENERFVCAHCVENECDAHIMDGVVPEEDVKSLALCGTCAIRKHYTFGHGICDFLPLLTSQQFQRYNHDQSALREKLEQQAEDVRSKMQKFEKFNEELIDIMDAQLERIRTALSTQQQDVFHRETEMVIESVLDQMQKMSIGMQDSLDALEVEQNELRSSSTMELDPLGWNVERNRIGGPFSLVDQETS